MMRSAKVTCVVLASLPVLLIACQHAPTVDDLYRSVAEQDVARVRELLKDGVLPTAQASGGETPLRAALGAVTGPARDAEFSRKKWPADSPPLLILQDIMRVVRASTHVPFEMTGELALVMQGGSSSLERGMTFLMSAYLKGPSRQYQLAISGWETALVNIDRSDGWNPVLRPGSTHRVVGAERDGVVEVYVLERVGEPVGKNALSFPIMNYLPSTFDQMRKHTWLGAPTSR